MCHPAVMIATTALAAAAQHAGQEAQADAAYGHGMEKRALTIASAADAARHQYQGISDRTSQARAKASQDIQNATMGYTKAAASARVAAAAGGVMGSSVEEVHQEFASRYEDYHASRELNLSWEEQQLIAQASGIQAQQRSRVEGTMFAPVQGANPFATAATVVQGVFSAYQAFPEHGMFEGWSGE